MSAVAVSGTKRTQPWNSGVVRALTIPAVIGILCIMVCELFVFNLPFWQTRGLTSRSVTMADYTLGEGLSRDGNEDVIIKNAGDEAYIEVTSEQEIKYLYLDTGGVSDGNDIRYELSVRQQGNTGWYTGGHQRVLPVQVTDGHYVHVGGNADGVRLTLRGTKDTVVPLLRIVINPRIPFSMDKLRIAAMLLLLMFIVVLRGGSPLYSIGLTRRFRLADSQLWCLVAFAVVQIAIVVGIWLVAGGSGAVARWPERVFAFTSDYDQYARLGDALIHGKTSLDLPVADSLAQMPNPYDSDLRGLAAQDSDVPIYWDHAFYDGKYYCYFGVIPAVLIFAPYQLLTGHWLSSTVAVLVLGIVASVLTVVLAVRTARVYFRKGVSLGSVMLAAVIFNTCSSMYYQVFTPNFYAIPGIMSLTLTLAALSCWLMAKREGCRSVSKPWLAIGSLFMAMNLGTRPQFILAAVLALPLFWNELVESRLFFSRKGIGNTIAALTPFIAVFAPLLAYNYVRFGSFLDFGASYNLTGFDMTVMKTPLRNLLPLFFYYLLQPFSLTGQFPFIQQVQTPLPLWSPDEPTPGGLLMICPCLLILLMVLRWVFVGRGYRNVRFCAYGCIGICTVIILVDAYSCGIAWRYYLDFAWLICLMATFAVFGLDQLRGDITKELGIAGSSPVLERPSYAVTETVHRLVIIGVLVAELLQFFSVFMTSRLTSMTTVNPTMFYRVADWFLAFE